MAEPEANKCGYWQDIKLRYADGQELKVRLDMPTIRKLENGDTALMEEIRRTYVSLPEPSMTCTNGNDSVETQSNREESRASELDETQSQSNLSGETTENGTGYTSWPKEAILLLISLYKEFEEKLEDPRQRKKDTWKIITQKIQEKGYFFSQNKVESKWRSLILSHKEVRKNNTQSGKRRKTFQFFQEIEEILCKRHDIYPTQLAGTGMGSNKEKFFSTKNKYDQDNGPSTSGDKDNGPSTSGDKDDGPSTSGDKDDGPSTSGAKDECPSTNDEGPSKRLSNSKCAAAKRAKREKIRQEQNTGCHIFELPQEILAKIVNLVLAEDVHCKLYAVNKALRDITYINRSGYAVHINILKNNCKMLSSMPNLKQLKIYDCFDNENIKIIVSCIKNALSRKLICFSLVNCKFGNMFQELVDILCRFSIDNLDFTACEKVTVGELRYTLSKMSNLRYCNIDIDIKCSDNSVFEFAQLANSLAGKEID
ncbi:hypothetical protein KUTeg_011872 [Tegillarca granosa]|uniref:Myb/SANT-like DNA-binding domain-containing protein n=1 Tax=Tegillarca granosa TaxID=220873 RepID=A0ABQ9F156_TEGGR|nr:hypothetical protein KUTeg_011872 [Tegillarca granosa]